MHITAISAMLPFMLVVSNFDTVRRFTRYSRDIIYLTERLGAVKRTRFKLFDNHVWDRRSARSVQRWWYRLPFPFLLSHPRPPAQP